MSFAVRSLFSVAGLSVGALSIAACTVAPAAGSSSAADGGSDASTMSADGGAVIPFTPSNTAAPSFEGRGDVDITNPCEIDTDTGKTDCDGLPSPDMAFSYAKIDQGMGAGKLAVFAVRSLRIEPSASLRITGSLPFLVFAATTIDVQGGLDASASGAAAHAGGFVGAASGAGGGPGGGGSSPNYNGGAGGSYCGVGGSGGVDIAPGSAPAGPYGSATLVPLLGGSSGGGGQGGLGGAGGAGGGAVQLVAGVAINVGSGGFINVGGGGGTHNGGAGGSGGALLLESPSIDVLGKLAANGGGGAVFDGGASGADGAPGTTRAAGSTATAGTGSAGTEIDGTTGTKLAPPYDKNSSGSGGGGAGRIRINTATGAAQITGVVSPSLSTSCVTQGRLAS